MPPLDPGLQPTRHRGLRHVLRPGLPGPRGGVGVPAPRNAAAQHFVTTPPGATAGPGWACRSRGRSARRWATGSRSRAPSARARPSASRSPPP